MASKFTTYTEILSTGFSFPMRLIPEGKFDMGATEKDGDLAYKDEKPQRLNVPVPAFYMGVHTVTQALWKAVMGEGDNPSRLQGDDRPVENVSWYEAQKFIEALNEQTLTQREENGLGAYRLPTEAEWEYAARGGPLNDRYLFAGSDKLLEVGWFEDNSDNETHEVGLLMANQLGLYDMSGNVWEWVEDHWHDNYAGAPADARTWLTNDAGAHRVLRGGGYFGGEQNCRVAYRYHYAPGDRLVDIGFRLALSPV